MTVVVLKFLALLVLSCDAATYCQPCNNTCWPSVALWEQLRSDLNGKLYSVNASMYSTCSAVETSNLAAWTLVDAAHGICMQHHNCAREGCVRMSQWNLPSYVVEAETEDMIARALLFATRYNIAVSIKTTGHSYSGSSTMKGTILIWMRNFRKFGTIAPFMDSCGTATQAVLKVGGGQNWYEAYGAVGSQYNLIGGGGKTVSAAGGWLQGGGLSAMSPSYGLGIDNVLKFEVVLGNGTQAEADACMNTDLFWALRGGGGGSFAVVTAVHYRLNPPTLAHQLDIDIELRGCTDDPRGQDCAQQLQALLAYYHFWVDVQQGAGLDRRWGGYWQLQAGLGPSLGQLYFLGSEADARTTLLDRLETWQQGLPSNQRKWIGFSNFSHNSYFEGYGHSDNTTVPSSFADWDIDSRLVPRSWVTQNGGADAKKMFDRMVAESRVQFTAYQLGGAVSDVATDATAINPAMRSAQWSMLGNPWSIEVLYDVAGSGTCNNHHGDTLPGDWTNHLFGSNVARLQAVKDAYDPAHRFNCFHCIGYEYLGAQDMLQCTEELPAWIPTSTQSPTTTTTVVETAANTASTIAEHTLLTFFWAFLSTIFVDRSRLHGQ